MKKIIITIGLVVLIPIGLLAGSGDINNDGHINAADVVELVNYLQGKASNYFNALEADVNDDGMVDEKDLESLVNIIIPGSSTNHNSDNTPESNIFPIMTEAICNDAIGTIGMSNSQINGLAAIYGTNDSGIEQFPVAGYDFNVGGNFVSCLKQNDLPNIGFVNFSSSDYITGGTGNSGKIFFTIDNQNNDNFDVKKYESKLVDSEDKTSPVRLSNVRKTNAQFTWFCGKKIEDNSIANDKVLYMADATITEKDLDPTKFHIEKFIDFKKLQNNIKTLINDLRMMKENSDSYSSKKAIYKNTLKELSSLALELYMNELAPANKNICYSPQRIALFKTENGLSMKEYQSDIDILTTVVKPLSYNTFWEYERIKDEIYESVLNMLVADIAREIIGSFGIDGISAEIISIDEANKTITLLVNNTTHTISINDDTLYSYLQKVFEMNYGIDEINSMINNLLKCYTLGDSSPKPYERIHTYLEESSDFFITLNNHIFTNYVVPFIFYETTTGMVCLHEGQYIKSGIMHAYLTSATNETLVPAYKKYIALKKDDTLQQSVVLSGNVQSFDFKLTEKGNYTVIISCVDYFGYVVTKKYNINVVD